MTSDDRRGSPRAAVSFPARIYDESSGMRRALLSARTLDLSLGGALLHGHARLDIGQTVRVEVPRGGTRNPLVLRAQVVRVEEPNPQMRRHGLALRWIDPDLADIAALASLLRDRGE